MDGTLRCRTAQHSTSRWRCCRATVLGIDGRRTGRRGRRRDVFDSGRLLLVGRGAGRDGRALRPGVAGVEPLPVSGGALVHAGGRGCFGLSKTGRFHRTRGRRGLALYKQCLRGASSRQRGCWLKLVLRKARGGSWACTLREPVHNSTFAAIRPTHRLICAQGRRRCARADSRGMELVARGAHGSSPCWRRRTRP